jgi:hypothetical protein
MIKRESLKRPFNLLLATAAVILLILPAAVSADTLILEDQPSCEALGGNWSPIGICMVDILPIDAADTLIVESSGYLLVNTKVEIDGELVNKGIVDLIGTMEVTDTGKLDNQDMVQVRPSAIVENLNLIENTGQFANGGSIMNPGVFDNKCQGELFGSGTFSGNEPVNSLGSPDCSSGVLLLFLPLVTG